MRILWFSNTPANAASYLDDTIFGGGWLQSLDKLIQNEVDLHIAFLNPKGPEKFEYGKTIYHSIMPKDWTKRLILQSVFGVDTRRDDSPLYLDIVREVKPDLIHIHGTESDYIRIIPKITIPVLVSVQGNLTVYHHKFNPGINERILKKVYLHDGLTVRSFLPKTMYRSKKDLYRKAQSETELMRNIKYIAGRTDWDYRITRVLSPESKYFYIGEVLREEFYNYRWAPPKNNFLKIFTTIGPSLRKGIETLCHSLSLKQNIYPNTEWYVAGVSKFDPIIRAVKKVLKDLYPDKGLHLLGKIGEAELIEQMLKSDLFVMPSHIENSPNSLCEAMILGMPCIATFAGGTPSLLEDGKEGILIQDGDPWAMAGAVLELAHNKSKAQEMGISARKTALKRHDKRKILEQILNTYQTILR